MAVPQNIYDGAQAFGTNGITGTEGTVTIGSTSYVVEESNITPEWTQANDFTAIGGPGRERQTKQRYSGTLTLQLATQTTPYPIPGATFTRVVPNEASSPLTFYVTLVPYTLSNSASGMRTAQITVRQVINGITTS